MKTDFLPVRGLDDVHVGRSGKLSCLALRLRDGSLCLYSPVAGLEKTLSKQLDQLGAVSALIAPNHYHNKGLAAHVEAFPDASLYCSAAAGPRLTKVTGLKFDPLERLIEALPDGLSLLEPDGLKTGEVWVRIKSATVCALAVTDAFSSKIHAPGEHGSEVTMLGTFPRYGIKDQSNYRKWAIETLSVISPTILLPCHGSPVVSEDLVAQLIGQLEEVV